MDFVFLALVLGQSQAPPINFPQQAPLIMVEKELSPYEQSAYRALSEGKLFVVFLETKMVPVPGAICYQYHGRFGNVQPPAVVISEPDGKGWFKIKEVRRQPRPFLSLPEAEAAAVDDDDLPWVHGIEKPLGLVRYLPAKFTQEIAVTDNRDRITPVQRTRLEKKWQVPGGFVGVTGWQSRLYKTIPENYMAYIGNIQVWNGSNFQMNRGHKRAYPIGTEFHDVLTNEKGEIFEHRIAEKKAEGWSRYVSYKNIAARPYGYHGLLGTKCASCHSEAGSGGYGVGLVPGGDTVISDPFTGLEP